MSDPAYPHPQPVVAENATATLTDAEREAVDTALVGEPVAWAALRDDGDIAWIGYSPEGAADGACGRRIVPLYRSPTLTDAEREAVEWGIMLMKDTGMTKHPDALRGLLERSVGAHKITETATASAADAAKRDTIQPRKGALRHE